MAGEVAVEWGRFREALRHVGIGLVAGIPVGILVVGVGGRLAMRVSGFLSRPELVGMPTEFGGAVGRITFEGTMFFVTFFGVGAGSAGGLLYAGLRPALARAGRWRGALFGALALAALGSVIIDPENFDFRVFGPAILNVAMFAALFILFGAALEPLYRRVDAASGAKNPRLRQRVVGILVWLAAIGALLLLGFIGAANANQIVSGHHPPQLIGATILGAVAVAILAVAVATGAPLLTRTVYGTVVVAAVVGALRTLTGIAKIVVG